LEAAFDITDDDLMSDEAMIRMDMRKDLLVYKANVWTDMDRYNRRFREIMTGRVQRQIEKALESQLRGNDYIRMTIPPGVGEQTPWTQGMHQVQDSIMRPKVYRSVKKEKNLFSIGNKRKPQRQRMKDKKRRSMQKLEQTVRNRLIKDGLIEPETSKNWKQECPTENRSRNIKRDKYRKPKEIIDFQFNFGEFLHENNIDPISGAKSNKNSRIEFGFQEISSDDEPIRFQIQRTERRGEESITKNWEKDFKFLNEDSEDL